MSDGKMLFLLIALALVGYLIFVRGKVEKSGIKLSYRLYDAEGNPIFSVVDGVQNVSYISITVEALNNRGSEMDVFIYDATPIEFYDSLPTDVKTVGAGQSVTWESGLMPTSWFESLPQPTVFWVKVQGYDYSTGETFYGEGSLSVEIKKSSGTPCTSDEECWSGICE